MITRNAPLKRAMELATAKAEAAIERVKKYNMQMEKAIGLSNKVMVKPLLDKASDDLRFFSWCVLAFDEMQKTGAERVSLTQSEWERLGI